MFALRFCFLFYVSSADWKHDDGIIYSSQNPKDGYYPNVGNGFIASNIGCYKDAEAEFQMKDINSQIGATPCGNIFMSGIYNGNLSDFDPLTQHYRHTSHRARIPGIHSYYVDTNIKSSGYNVTWIGATVDIKSGTVNNRSIIQHPTKCIHGGTVQITNYMHRSIKSLMVLNVSLIDYNHDDQCEIILNDCNFNNTNDFVYKQWQTKNNNTLIELRQMTTIIKETLNSTIVNVSMAFQPVTTSIILSKANSSISFYGVLHNSLTLDTNISDAMDLTMFCENEVMQYIELYTPSEIYLMHVTAMESIWNSRVEFIGNETINKGIYAAYYYLLNALRGDYNFSTSPGGVVSNAYRGHMFWDAETWMFPTLALIYPSVASVMLKYRLDRIYGAQRFANKNYNSFIGNCAQYPWEDAFSGDPVCVIPNLDHKEQHINADVARAVKIFYYATNNKTWYFNTKSVSPNVNSINNNQIQYNYWNLHNQTCNFWGNRFSKIIINSTYYYYTIFNVVPPDESAGVVNSSIYTNVAAGLMLKFCLNISQTFKNEIYIPNNISLLWEDIINHLYLPTSNKLPGSNGELLHLEYQSYNGQDVNQADVALVQYPLQYFDDNIYDVFTPNNTVMKELLMNDLIYYQLKTTEGNTAGFFTGDSSYSIAWLRLLNVSMAQSFFDAAFSHMDTNHFYIFVEKLKQNGGHLNFLTGIGGLLQNTLYGYAGAHLTDNYLYFNPLLPLLSASNITDIKFHGLIYRGIQFKFQFNANRMSFALKTINDQIFDEYFILSSNDTNSALYIETLIPNYATNTIKINKTYTLTSTLSEINISRSLCRVSQKSSYSIESGQ